MYLFKFIAKFIKIKPEGLRILLETSILIFFTRVTFMYRLLEITRNTAHKLISFMTNYPHSLN